MKAAIFIVLALMMGCTRTEYISRPVQRPALEIVWPQDHAIFGAGQLITISASTRFDASVVTFSVNGETGEDYYPPFLYDWQTPREAGPFVITVEARDFDGRCYTKHITVYLQLGI